MNKRSKVLTDKRISMQGKGLYFTILESGRSVILDEIKNNVSSVEEILSFEVSISELIRYGYLSLNAVEEVSDNEQN